MNEEKLKKLRVGEHADVTDNDLDGTGLIHVPSFPVSFLLSQAPSFQLSLIFFFLLPFASYQL